jgi:predicted aspartyl protease
MCAKLDVFYMPNLNLVLIAAVAFLLGYGVSETVHSLQRHSPAIDQISVTHSAPSLPETSKQLLPGSEQSTATASLATVDAAEISLANIEYMLANAQFETAVAALKHYLEMDPKSLSALRLLARAYQGASHYPEALDAWFTYLGLEVDGKKRESAIAEIKNYLAQLKASPVLMNNDVAWLLAQYEILSSYGVEDSELHLALALMALEINDSYRAQYHALMAMNNSLTQARAEEILAKLNGVKNTLATDVPLVRIGNQFLVDVNVEGSAARLLVDTGASISGLSREFTLKHLGALKNQKPIELQTAAGTQSSSLFTVDSIGFAGLVFNQHMLAQLPMDTGQGIDGLLGVDILGRFDFVLDQNAAVLKLQPRKHP